MEYRNNALFWDILNILVALGPARCHIELRQFYLILALVSLSGVEDLTGEQTFSELKQQGKLRRSMNSRINSVEKLLCIWLGTDSYFPTSALPVR